MSEEDSLIQNIQGHKARIGVIGLAYVGLPLVLRFGEEHFSVIGFDVDAEKVRKLNAGESYIRHIPAARLQTLMKERKFEATTDFGRLAGPDCIIICVPKPLTAKKDPDLQYIDKTADSILKTLRKGQLISIESTTYPEKTKKILLERFRDTGLEVGKDFFLVFSPKREAPDNPNFSTRTIPKIVGETPPACLEAGK